MDKRDTSNISHKPAGLQPLDPQSKGMGPQNRFARRGLNLFLMVSMALAWGTTHLSALQPPSNLEDTDHQGTDWIISASTVIAGTHKNIGLFEVRPGVELKVMPSTVTTPPWESGQFGKVAIYASTIVVNGEIDALGSGHHSTNSHSDGIGPGAGTSCTTTGSGAGHAGKGGNGEFSFVCPNGTSYGIEHLNTFPPSLDDISLGSSGGNGNGLGGNGGGAVLLNASSVTFNYVVVSGTNAFDQSGGGSGGTIIIDSYEIAGSTLEANGGNSGLYSGGGSGGRIKLFYSNINISSLTVSGGSSINTIGLRQGENGTIFSNHKPSIPADQTPFGSISDINPIFSWGQSSDFESDNINYELIISTSYNYLPILISTVTTQTNFIYNNSLLPNLYYFWKIRSYDQFSYSNWKESAIYVDITTPSSIQILNISKNVSSFNVTVSTSNDTETLASKPYIIEVSSSPQFLWISTSSLWQASTQWIAAGLDPDTSYYFRTKARDSAFNESDWSPTAISKTLSSRVENIHAALAGPTSFQIAWSPGINSPGTTYYIEISTSPSDFHVFSSSDTQSLSLTIVETLPNTTYYFKVANKDWAQYPYEFVQSSTLTLAGVPAFLPFTQISINSLRVNWDKLQNPAVTEFKIAITSSNSPETMIESSLWQASTYFVFNNLEHNTSYWFWLKSRNFNHIESDYLPAVSTATLSSTPGAPSLESGYDDVSPLGYFIRVHPSYGTNHPATHLAIQNDDTEEYLQGDGTTGVAPVWMPRSDWENGIRNTEGALAGLSVYRYKVWTKNFENHINSTASAISSEITPPVQPSLPMVEEIEDDALKIGISYVPGAEKYWLYYSTWSQAPPSQYVQIATITPSATNYVDDFDGGSPSPPVFIAQTVSSQNITLFWSNSTVPESEPRYYRLAALDNLNRSGQKSGMGAGPSKITPVVEKYGFHKNGEIAGYGLSVSYDHAGLTPNTSYEFRVSAHSNEGKTSFSVSTPGITDASIPYKPLLTAESNHSIRISLSADEKNPAHTEYAVLNLETNSYLRADGALQADATFYKLGGNGILHAGLAPNQSCSYKLKAKGLNGTVTNWGEPSDSVHTLSNPPQLVSLSHSSHIWTNASTASFSAANSDHYRYVLDKNALTSPTTQHSLWNGNPLTVSLTSEGTWYFHIRGYNSGDLASGADHFGPILLDTTPPQGLNFASLAAETSRQIRMEAGSQDLRSGTSTYFFETLGDAGAVILTPWSADPIYIHDDLLPNTSYAYRFTAADRAGNSAASTPAVKYTLASEPLLIGNPKTSGSGLTVQWGAGQNPAGTLYEVEFSTAANFASIQITTATLLPGVTVPSLMENTTYYIRARAKNHEGLYTDYVFLSSKLTPLGSIAIDPGPSVNMTSASIQWTNLPDAEYWAEAADDPNFSHVVRSMAWSKTGNAHFDGLTPNTSYYFRVKSRNTDLEESPFQLFNPAALLPAPAQSSEEPISYSHSSIKYVWAGGGNPSDTEYRVSVSTDAGFSTIIQGPWVQATYYVFPSLNEDETYWARVVSRNRHSLEAEALFLSSRSTLSPAPLVTSVMPQGSWSAGSKATFTAVNSNHYHVRFSTLPYEEPLPSDTFWNGTEKTFEMPFDGAWYLHVGGDNREHSNSGVVHMGPFRRDATAPSLPTPLSPADKTVVNASSFVWTGSDDANPVEYVLEISHNPGFNPFHAQKLGLTDTFYFLAPTEELTDLTTYYWRVRARDSLGNSSGAASSNMFFNDAGDMAITGRETQDRDTDGAGETLKIRFNQPVLTSSILPEEFQILNGGKEVSIKKISAVQENPKGIYLILQSTFSSLDSPQVRYKGHNVQSLRGKKLKAETEPVPCVDRIGPDLEHICVVSIDKSEQTRVLLDFSEPLTASDALDPNHWALETPGNKAIPMTFANIQYETGSRRVKLSFPFSLSAKEIKIIVRNMKDSQGNLREEMTKTAKVVQKEPGFDEYGPNKGKKPFGKPANPKNMDITAFFDREMDPASLSSCLKVTLQRNRSGHVVNVPVSGSVEISKDKYSATFLPETPLGKGCTYKVTLSSGLKDAAGFVTGEESGWEFRTVADPSLQNTVHPADCLKVILNPGVFAEEADIKVNWDPVNNAERADRSVLAKALERERQRGAQTGSLDHYPIASMTLEIFGETAEGKTIQGKLGNYAVLALTFPDANGDGVVDGTNPPVPAQNLRFYHFDENIKDFVKVPGSVVDLNNRTVTAGVDHFSVFTLMAESRPDVSKALARPNPWNLSQDPEPVILDNLPDPCQVDIYSITGEKIKSLQVRDGNAARWDATDQDGNPAASGVYLVRVKTETASKNLKLTLIR